MLVTSIDIQSAHQAERHCQAKDCALSLAVARVLGITGNPLYSVLISDAFIMVIKEPTKTLFKVETMYDMTEEAKQFVINFDLLNDYKVLSERKVEATELTFHKSNHVIAGD